MSKEKSQLENIALPPQGGEATQAQKESSALPPSFSLGQQLITKGKSTPRSKTLKYFLPDYPSGIDRDSQEEKERKIWMEKEGINYDLYLLIKEKLAGEFGKKIIESKKIWLNDRDLYEILSQTSFFDYIGNDPKIYTPNEKDVIFIANHLNELLAEQNISQKGNPEVGIFLNFFIHAYFNSIPQEKRKDLKLNLPNTKDLDFIGAELSFGELEVEEARHYFGYQARDSVILKAKKVKYNAGLKAHDNARMEVGEATTYFGYMAHGDAILKADKTGDYAGSGIYERAQILVNESQDYFGSNAKDNAFLQVGVVGSDVGSVIKDNVKIKITERYGSLGHNRSGASQIILPDGRALGAKDFL